MLFFTKSVEYKLKAGIVDVKVIINRPIVNLLLIWESALAHVIQRFMSTNFPLKVGLSDSKIIMPLNRNTWLDTLLVLIISFPNVFCFILQIYFSDSKKKDLFDKQLKYEKTKQSSLRAEMLHYKISVKKYLWLGITHLHFLRIFNLIFFVSHLQLFP